MGKFKIELSYEQLQVLKEALLCAEVNRDNEYQGTGKKFEALHIEIDEQTMFQVSD